MKGMRRSVRSFWTASIFIALMAGVAGAGYPSASSAAGNDVGRVGLGLAWQPLDLALATGASNAGYVTGRYWLSDKFGIDGGIGMGLPSVSGPTAFQMNLAVTPMYALKRWGSSVFYADAQVLPSIITGGGTSFLLSFSTGIGIESALPGTDDVRWYAQLNPLSIDYFNPAGAGNDVVGFDFLGAAMPVSFGLHYYF